MYKNKRNNTSGACHVPIPSKTKTQFPRWTTTESLWNRHSVDFDSPVSTAIRCPKSLSSSRVLGPMAPRVSMAIGEKE